jgi:(p)ppGpp synthase/HD superfamily hydrolase
MKKKYDQKMWSLCVKVARDIHKGQTRKMGEDKGKPYIIHPERVSMNLFFASRSEDYGDACVGVLHDCIEDYDPTTLADSEDKDGTWTGKGYLGFRGVPKDIIKDVLILSKKEGEGYYDFIMRVLKSERAIRAKIEDIKDNLQSLEDGKLKDKYLMALHILKTELKLKKAKKGKK